MLMNLQMRENKLYLFAGSLFFFLLMILSIVFYKERILHSDNVFYAFKLYQTHGFDIEERRLADVLTQVFPLLAIKIGLVATRVMVG